MKVQACRSPVPLGCMGAFTCRCGSAATGTREMQTVGGGGVRKSLVRKAVSQNEPHGAATDVRERLPPREGCIGKKAF